MKNNNNFFEKEIEKIFNDDIDDDSILDEYLYDSDEENEKQPPPPPPPQQKYPTDLTPEQIAERHQYVLTLGEEYLETLPPKPDKSNPLQRILFLYFYATQFIILFNKLNGKKPVPQFYDTDKEIKEKAYFIHLNTCFNEFIEMMDDIALNIYNKIKLGVCAHLGGISEFNLHPISFLLQQVLTYQELHSRRAKLNPSTNIQDIWNCITCEKYNPNNEDHRLWKILIFVPLHSDFDNEAIDLAEEPCQINAPVIPKPFGLIVTNDWDKIIRILHISVYFKDYFFNYINDCIKSEEWKHIDELSWNDTWKYLTKDFGDIEKTKHDNNEKTKEVLSTIPENVVITTINNFSREKKQVPLIIFRISVLRDFLKVVIKF